MAKIKNVVDTTTNAPVVDINGQTQTQATMADVTASPDGMTQTEPEPKPEPTSAKLTELNAEIDAQWDVVANAAPKSKEWREASMKIIDLETAVETEKKAIAQQEVARLLKEKENARVAMFDNALSAYMALQKFEDSVRGENGMIPAEHHEESNRLNGEFKTLREAVVNELLKSVPRGTPSKSVATGTTSGKRGGITAEIRELITPMYAEGKTGSDVRSFIIKEKGYNDGTANAVIRAYELENGLTK